MRLSRRQLCALVPLMLAGPLQAQEAAGPVDIHGFGSWSYGRTSQNHYLSGSPEGDYRLVSLSLNLSRKLDQNLSVHAQGSVTEDHDDTHVNLTYAFADYRINDRLSFRIGQVKHPFGMHTEVFAVGTLRPFLDLPQGFYGPVGFAGESYKGIGATGTAEIGAWTLAYDAYAGGNDLRKYAVPENFYKGNSLQVVAEEIELQSARDVVGGRLVFDTPVSGLSFGGSSYTGILNEPASNRRSVVAGQIAYHTNALTLESEIAHHVQTEDENATGGYALAAYRLSPEWQVAAQYDALKNEFAVQNVTTAPSLQYHHEGAVAVSRWFSRSFVIKTEYHYVSGNRFATPDPESLVAIVAAQQLKVITHLFKFGAQFAF